MVEWKKLGEICYISDYVSNGSFASLRENVQYKSEPDYAILVRFADYSNGFDTSKFVYIDEHAYHFLSKSYLEGGEIIMSNVGSCGLLFRCPKLDRKMSLAPNSILIKSEFIDYLYYWLGGNVGQEEIRKITSKSAMPKFNKTEFKKIQIPIPSLEEQNRIVGILDTFTASIDNLKEQIAQRRKQFEYYRDQLLDLEGKEGVEMKTTKDICRKICSGGTPSTSKHEYYGGSIPWLRTQEVDWKEIYDTEIKITEEAIANSSAKIIPANCVIVAMYGATAAKVAINKIPLSTNQACCNLEIDSQKALYKYVFHWLCKEYQNLKSMGEGSQNNINGQKVKEYPIPVPSLQDQQRIVSILDTFEASIQNLEVQLSQREKQYEYYRNKLLTFE